MTAMPIMRRKARTAATATLALLAGLAIAAPAMAFEPLAPVGGPRHSYKDKYKGDGDVTVIIIDRDDRPTSTVPKPKASSKSAATPPAPTGGPNRDDDTTIIIKTRDAKRTKPRAAPGPKVIIVDRDSGCGGSGVCVIRP